MIIIAPHSLSRWRGTCGGDRTTTPARLCHNLRRGFCPHAIKIGHRTEEISALTPRSSYILGPTCWGSIPLYVSFLDYKSEGTLDTRNNSNTQARHSCLGNTTLSQADVGYYVPAVWTSLDPRVFLRDCVFFHLSRQTSQPLLILGLVRMQSTTRPEIFLSFGIVQHLPCTIRPLCSTPYKPRFCFVSSLYLCLDWFYLGSRTLL